MKRKALFLQFLMFLFTMLCQAQENDIPHGINLSNEILEICNANDVKVETQNLVSNITNEFPYNILVSFPSTINDENNENLRTTLLIILRQEDVYQNPKILTNLLIILSAEERDFDTKIILTFSDSQKISKTNSIFGSIAYLNSLDEQSKYSCILVSPFCEKSQIISGSGESVSPTWFVKNVYSAYNKDRLLYGYENAYISFVYKLNLFRNPIQKSFLDAGIPCINACFGNDISHETISDTIMNIARNYNYKETYQADYHSIMYSLFSHQIWLTEGLIIKMILASVFLALSILFSYGFINEKFKFTAWQSIRKIWQYPFIIYFLALAIFFTANFLLDFLRTTIAVPISLFSTLAFILPLIFILVCRTFLFTLQFSADFKRKTIDHLVFITGTINLCFFCLLDISLYPIFLFEFFLALVSTIGKKLYYHIIMLVLVELPFLPFIMQIFNNADFLLLNDAIIYNIAGPFFLILIFLPTYWMCFRLLTGFSFYWRKRDVAIERREVYNVICLACCSAIFVAIIYLISPADFKKIKYEETEQYTLSMNAGNSIDISTSKRPVFGDVIRTIKINSEKPIMQCDLRVKGEKNSPVLFSDYDFIAENLREAVFPIPYEPPNKMEFSYGESGANNKIILTVVYSDFTLEQVEVDCQN